jgi:hypothetical protein
MPNKQAMAIMANSVHNDDDTEVLLADIMK